MKKYDDKNDEGFVDMFRRYKHKIWEGLSYMPRVIHSVCSGSDELGTKCPFSPDQTLWITLILKHPEKWAGKIQ